MNKRDKKKSLGEVGLEFYYYHYDPEKELLMMGIKLAMK